MDKLIFTAMSGATRVMHSQQVVANNLANVNTPGFRADIELAKTVDIKGQGHQTRSLVASRPGGVDFSEGTLQHTDNALDVAIRGQGFFAVETEDGTEAYTRSGAFHLNENRELMLGNRAVIGQGGPITLPEYSKLDIGNDGTISITPQEGGLVQEVDRLKLVSSENEQIYKASDGLFRVAGQQELDIDEQITVASGYRESSNVNAIDALVSNISMSRNFEFQIKMMKTAEELVTAGNRLIRA